MTLTRREKHALVVFVLILISVFVIPQQRTLDDFQLAYLVLVIIPLGLYIATDPERIKKE